MAVAILPGWKRRTCFQALGMDRRNATAFRGILTIRRLFSHSGSHAFLALAFTLRRMYDAFPDLPATYDSVPHYNKRRDVQFYVEAGHNDRDMMWSSPICSPK